MSPVHPIDTLNLCVYLKSQIAFEIASSPRSVIACWKAISRGAAKQPSLFHFQEMESASLKKAFKMDDYRLPVQWFFPALTVNYTKCDFSNTSFTVSV